MAYSMTGYGTAKANINGIDVEVQVKTLNHRSLDMHVSMGNMPGQLELLFQKMIMVPNIFQLILLIDKLNVKRFSEILSQEMRRTAL